MTPLQNIKRKRAAIHKTRFICHLLIDNSFKMNVYKCVFIDVHMYV